jgi:hypothetical protein
MQTENHEKTIRTIRKNPGSLFSILVFSLSFKTMKPLLTKQCFFYYYYKGKLVILLCNKNIKRLVPDFGDLIWIYYFINPLISWLYYCYLALSGKFTWNLRRTVFLVVSTLYELKKLSLTDSLAKYLQES